MGGCVKKSEESSSSLKKNEHAILGDNLSGQDFSIKYTECYNCGDKASSRMRCFSEKAWSVLLHWNEISASTVEKPICDYCYKELRAVLMERMDEFDTTISETKTLEL